MYYEHFGLKEPPFKITPNTDFFFGGGNRGPILEALIYAISQGEGIVKVTGEVGSGKTMLCSMLQSRLPENVETIYLANPSVSPDEILHAIAFELQLEVTHDAGRLAVMHALQDHLLKRHAEGRRVVLFVEESQGMPIATLEEIRLLSNLETKSDKLLQIVLFGQPELDENLRQNQIRQLKERITHSFRLEPLTAAETREYLMFRMRAAGYRGPDLFSDAIVREIARISGGLTRRINLIADKALLAAFADNTHTLRQKHIDAAVRDSEFAREPAGTSTAPARPRWALGAVLVVAGMAAGAGLYGWWLQQPAGESQGKTSPATPAATPQPSPSSPINAATQQENNSIKTNTYDDSGKSPSSLSVASTDKPAPAPNTETPAPAATRDNNPRAIGQLLNDRLAATTKWLAQSPPQTYTVQLLGSHDEKQLNQHLRFISNIIEINDVFVYRTLAKGEPALTLTWGNFDNPRAAREAMAKLPPSLKMYRPLLRTVQGIKTEIASNNPS
ncbi:MAG: AAA family ATPase [Burkholderiales bacterium]|nr:AAA family ATPase [Burkholderiales bacterium]